jgi:hypothetical protein
MAGIRVTTQDYGVLPDNIYELRLDHQRYVKEMIAGEALHDDTILVRDSIGWRWIPFMLSALRASWRLPQWIRSRRLLFMICRSVRPRLAFVGCNWRRA